MLTLALLAAVLIALGVLVVFAYRKEWHWTGLPAAPAASSGAEDRPAKTLWDWLQLFGIPVVLVTLAFLLSDAQTRRDQQRELREAELRETLQRAAAIDVERESTLRTYLAQMSDLMLDRGLLRSKEGADVRNVARTATLTAVRRLDGPRRGLVVQFLAEARLLRRRENASPPRRIPLAQSPPVRLALADLRGADLGGATLRRRTSARRTSAGRISAGRSSASRSSTWRT